MYKSRELESVIVESINTNKKNVIYACIYRHPSMEVEDFNKNYFDLFLEKLTKENKISYLLGDFNIDLLKTETDENINNFYNLLNSHLFIPHITIPTRITSHSKTLIDNIFSNNPQFTHGISGNFTFSISDHLPQFLIMPGKRNTPPKKHNIQKRNMKSLDNENLVADVTNINWHELLSVEKMDVNYSFDNVYNKISEIIEKHAPLKKLSKKEIKLQAKPWITPGIINSITRRDKLLRLYIKTNEQNRKQELHRQYKTLRNKIVTLIRNSKKLHFQNYFTENSQDIRKTWTGIKNIINIHANTKNQPTSILSGNNKLETDPTKIANGFNDYFSSIAEKLQQKIVHG